MSANACPRCHKPLPESVLRDLARGTSCPSCSAPLKRAPRRALDAAATEDDGYASIEVGTSLKVNTTPPPSLKPAAGAALKPAAVATTTAPAPTNLRATMMGATVAQRALPFNGPPAQGSSFALAAPATAPPVRAAAPPLPSLRAVPAPAPAAAAPPPPPAPARLPLPGSVPAAASRGLGTVSTLVTASDSEPTRVAQPPRGVATVTPLVTASDEEPTNVAHPPHERASVAPLLGDGDSDAIASVTIRPDSAPVFAPVTLQPVARRRGLAIVGVGMGLAIVGLFAVGVKMVGGRKTAAPAAPAEIANPAAEAPPPAPVPPVVEAVQPPPARQPPAPKTPAPKAAAPVAAAKPAAVPAAKPVVEKRAPASRHRTKAHHRREARARKVAMQAPAAKRSAPPQPPPERADPRPPYERGNALLFAGDGKAAIVAYREAVKSAPSDPIGFRGLGLAYEQQGETASAIRALRRYLKLAPNAADREIISRRIDRLAKRTKQK